jgi:hypothetical protein
MSVYEYSLFDQIFLTFYPALDALLPPTGREAVTPFPQPQHGFGLTNYPCAPVPEDPPCLSDGVVA